MLVILVTILLVYFLFLLPLCFCLNWPLERVELDLSHPRTSQLTVIVWGGGGGLESGGGATTPQAVRVTDSDGGGRVRVGELDLSHPPRPPPTVLISNPQTSQLTVSGGGGLGSGGWATTPPRHKLVG